MVQDHNLCVRTGLSLGSCRSDGMTITGGFHMYTSSTASRRGPTARLGVAIAVMAVAMTSVGVSASPSQATPAYEEYVALGDSFPAGPLIPWQTGGPCARSTNNYPAVLAESLGVSTFTDMTCSGATTTSLSSQYGALSETTDLVTLTIGANDAGLFQTTLGCINLLPWPFGLSCKARLTAGGTDQMADAVDATAPDIGAALREIRSRAPEAQVVITTYTEYIREGGCYGPTTPIWPADGDYLQGTMDRLYGHIEDQAAANGATFVDIAGQAAGHDVCASPADRWVEPLIPSSFAAPIHPNAQGMEAFAGIIEAQL
jgi:lysophospholipase L1-like esterase